MFALIIFFLVAGHENDGPQTKTVQFGSKASCEAFLDKLYATPPPVDKIPAFQGGCVELRPIVRGV